MFIPEIKVFPDPAAVAAEAAERFVTLAAQTIEAHGQFSVALAGGSTPRAMYQLLASEPMRARVQWERLLIFFGDERCVPPDHSDSNFGMARQMLLSRTPVPAERVFRMRGEIDPDEAAKEYGLLLKEKFGDGGVDLMLLGMGDDGHTLSLFPGTPAVSEREHRVVANYAEHSTTGKSWRITMTVPFANRSSVVLVCVTGASKAKRLQEVLEGEPDGDRLPIQLIKPVDGQMVWLLDAAAADM